MEHVFPKRLREVRESTGLSQTEFAKKIGISRASLSYYENATRTPDVYLLESIYKATGVSIYYLLGITDTKDDGFHELKKDTGLSESSLSMLCALTESANENDYLSRMAMNGINLMLENNIGIEIIHAIHTYLTTDFSRISFPKYNDTLVIPVIDDGREYLRSKPYILIENDDNEMRLALFPETIEAAYVSTISDAIKSWKEELKNGEKTPEQ